MAYGLKEEEIAKISLVFSHYPKINEVILYGSRAKGNYKPGSDIDLTMKGEELNLDNLTAVGNELDDLLLPYTFDVSNYLQIDNENLIEHIDRVGIVIYQTKLVKNFDRLEK